MRKIISKSKSAKRIRLHKKIRSKIFGNAEIPRLAVFRSNKFIYAQIIDDNNGKTLTAASDISKNKNNQNKTISANLVGKNLAEQALKLKIKKIVFDRGGFNYTGRVAALAIGAREGGLEF